MCLHLWVTPVSKSNYVGKTINGYKIIEAIRKTGKKGNKSTYYKIQCVHCGYISISPSNVFNNNTDGKCNHINKYGEPKTPPYSFQNQNLSLIFQRMKRRCYNHKSDNYKWYGGKGIKICDEWLNNPKSFEEWSLSHGYEDGLTIDRIDSNKDYCPENCRWITRKENITRATSIIVEINGISMNKTQWSKLCGKSTGWFTAMERSHDIEYVINLIKNKYLPVVMGSDGNILDISSLMPATD